MKYVPITAALAAVTLSLSVSGSMALGATETVDASSELVSSATDGAWSAPFTPAGASSRVIGVHSVLLHTGKVLVFGALRPTQGYIYDPVSGSATQTDPPVDIECGAVTPLADGRILVVGGHAKGAKGIKNILLFDPVRATWTPQPSTPQGRYYPTTTRLADGRVLITGGFTDTGAQNNSMEVYTPPAAGQTQGTLTKVGTHQIGLYPYQWLMPDGRVFEATARSSAMLDPATWTWTTLSKPKAKHYSGEGAVLLPGPPSGSTRVILTGGGNSTSATAAVETFNAATPSAGWSALASMPSGRAHMSPVLLPDGTLLGVGGNSAGQFQRPQYAALRYDPKQNTWSTLAAQTERRGYHSTAVLLPDGRVLSAGDTGAGGGGNTNEIFSPPYLFQGARPSISSAPAQVANGARFSIGTPNPSSRAVLMSPGAATHTTDMNERHIELAVTAGSGAMTAVAPSRTVAAPGWYMLFLVSSTGVPSTAKWVHLG